MENYCAFSKDHKCILWLDYELTGQELEECHTLCHGNWIEIEHKSICTLSPSNCNGNHT